MAVTTVETIIANPARKQGKRKAKARKGGSMTAKQIKYFGTARQRAALKAKRRKPAKAKSNPARKHKAAPRKTVHRKRTERRNPGEIISLVLGNPAKRRKKAVATTKKRKKASARRNTSAGRRTTKRNPAKMHHPAKHRRNPAGGMNVTDLVALGGGAMLGGAVPAVISQAVLKEKNTGMMGYLANLASTLLLAWGAHKVAKGPTGASFAKGILAGGIGSVIKRAITDYSLLGTYGQTLGLGDYMVANFTNPPRVADGLNSPMYEIPGGGWAPTTVIAAPAAAGMGCYGGAPLY